MSKPSFDEILMCMILQGFVKVKRDKKGNIVSLELKKQEKEK